MHPSPIPPFQFGIESFNPASPPQRMSQSQVRVTNYEIYWFFAAQGSIMIDSMHYPVMDNSLFCLVPGVTRPRDISELGKGYRISFSHDFLCIASVNSKITSWLDPLSIRNRFPLIRVDADLQSDITDIVLKMEREFANYYLLRSEILSGLLNILLIHISRKVLVLPESNTINAENDLVARFKFLLKKYYISRKLVSDYASELFVSPNYLNRTVRKVTGFTASHHIQQYVILEAKRKALCSNVSMKEIAYSLGFDNLAHFSKFFKSNSGMNFTSFKKSTQAA